VSRPPCLACARNPAHQIDNEDGTILSFCAEHWALVLERLLALGPRFQTLIDGGCSKEIAIARLAAEIDREFREGGTVAAGEIL